MIFSKPYLRFDPPIPTETQNSKQDVQSFCEFLQNAKVPSVE